MLYNSDLDTVKYVLAPVGDHLQQLFRILLEEKAEERLQLNVPVILSCCNVYCTLILAFIFPFYFTGKYYHSIYVMWQLQPLQVFTYIQWINCPAAQETVTLQIIINFISTIIAVIVTTLIIQLLCCLKNTRYFLKKYLKNHCNSDNFSNVALPSFKWVLVG